MNNPKPGIDEEGRGGGGGGCSSHLPLPWREEALADSEPKVSIGPLHDPVTWYKITNARTQATHTTSLWPAFDLEVPLCNLRPCMSDFVLCDRIEQRDYCCFPGPLIVKKFPSQSCQEIDRTKKLSAAKKKRKTVLYHDFRISSSDSVKPFDITVALPSSMLKIPTPNWKKKITLSWS